MQIIYEGKKKLFHHTTSRTVYPSVYYIREHDGSFIIFTLTDIHTSIQG